MKVQSYTIKSRVSTVASRLDGGPLRGDAVYEKGMKRILSRWKDG